MDSSGALEVIIKKLKIIIPIPPVTKKNSQQIIYVKGRHLPIPSKKYKEYETGCEAFLYQYRNIDIDYKVNVKCIYFMPTKRRVDLVNLQEATLDVLVAYKIIDDDNSQIVASMDGSRVYYDKENPRTEIEISCL